MDISCKTWNQKEIGNLNPVITIKKTSTHVESVFTGGNTQHHNIQKLAHLLKLIYTFPA